MGKCYSNADIKKFGDVEAHNAAGHNLRQIPSANVNPKKSHLNKFYVGSANMNFDHKVASKLGKFKLRKNAVKSVNLVFSASPEFFNDKKNGQQWEEQTFDFLVNEFGVDNIIYAVVHHDEETPHFHVSVIPVDPKGKLNASHFFDGRKKCNEFTTRYNNAVKNLGLLRDKGNKKSKPQDTRDFYQKVKDAKSSDTKVDKVLHALEKDLSSPIGFIKCSAAKKHVNSLAELVKYYKAQAINDRKRILEAEKIKQENEDLKLKFENMGLSPDMKFSECGVVKHQISVGRSAIAEIKAQASKVAKIYKKRFTEFLNIHRDRINKMKLTPRSAR